MSSRRSTVSRLFSRKTKNGDDGDQTNDTTSTFRAKKRSIFSPDSVRNKVLTEGRSARNLVTWSVPVSTNESKPRSKRKKPRKFGELQTLERVGVVTPAVMVTYSGPAEAVKRTGGGGGGGDAVRLSRDLKARYWSYLFDNLQRAVDEIYATCEMDVSVVECKEVIMTLDVCRRDFQSLIDRIKVQEAFEKADSADRPTSLAWEVRKTLPGKSFHSSSQDRHTSQPTSPAIDRRSTVSADSEQKQATISWADRVKGVKPVGIKIQPTCTELIPDVGQTSNKEKEIPIAVETNYSVVDTDGGEGWETVRRSRAGRGARRRLENEDQFRAEASSDNRTDSKETDTTNRASKSEQHTHTDNITISIQDTTNEIGDHLIANMSEQSDNKMDRTENDDASQSVSDVTHQSISNQATNCSNGDHINDIDGLVMEPECGVTQDSTLPVSNVTVRVDSGVLYSSEEDLAVALFDDERPPTQMGDEQLVVLSDVEDESKGSVSLGSSTRTLDWQEMVSLFDADAGFRESTSWADRCESPPETRSPGRAIHLHQKLSSPSRKSDKTADEHKKMIEEKQVKAQLQRDRLQEEKAEKLRIHTKKVQEVREIKDEQLRQKRVNMEQKLLRAEQLRSTMLQERIRKAQEEEIKVSEIAFINSLEAQNKKMEMQEKQQGQESRLQNIEEERQRKREEQQAKEDAAQERKRVLEAERLARLEEMKQKRKEQDAKVEQMLLERERAREEAAKEKARERERRQEARMVAHQLSLKERKKRIESRQSETLKRYDQQLEQKKAKAAVHSRHGSEDACTLTNETMRISSSLLRNFSSPNSSIGSSHHHSGLSLDVEGGSDVNGSQRSSCAVEESRVLQERLKSLKKRVKKLRQRMSSKATSYESTQASAVPSTLTDSPNKTRIQKAVKEIGKLLRSQTGVGVWPDSSVVSLDKAMIILRHSLEQNCGGDKVAFRVCAGFPTLFRVLLLVETCSSKVCGPGPGGVNAREGLPLKLFTNVCRVLMLACHQCGESCHYLLLSNKLGSAVDLLAWRLASLQQGNRLSGLPSDSLASSVMELLATSMAGMSGGEQYTQSRVDLVSYLVCQGVVERLHLLLAEIEKPNVVQSDVGEFVRTSLQLMVALTEMILPREAPFDVKSQDAPQLASAFSYTNLLDILRLLYVLLLHGGAPRYSSCSPQPLIQSTIHITTDAFRLLNRIARLDLNTVQTRLGAEGNSLEFRHVTGYVLWYCSKHKNESLLHEAIEFVGYFVVNNPSGQAFLQSGRSPTLLQLLCCLPFQYFSDPRLTRILFPTLIAACYNCPANKLILQQEMSCVLLATFIDEHVLLRSSTAPINTAYCDVKMDSDAFASRFPVSEWEKASAFLRE